jgi:hypothetical protein
VHRCRASVQRDDRRFDRELITVVIAIDQSAANFPGVAVADPLAAIRAAGIGFQIGVTDNDTAHRSPPVRLICAINDLNDANAARALLTAGFKKPSPAR